jgi:transcriptional regulator with XRE-family HTH domain
MHVKTIAIYIAIEINDMVIMKINQTNTLTQAQASELADLGAKLAKLRIARRMLQEEASLRAGLSRSTISNIERGSPSVAVGQIFRYLDSIAPGKTLSQLLTEKDSAVVSLDASRERFRARALTKKESNRLNF